MFIDSLSVITAATYEAEHTTDLFNTGKTHYTFVVYNDNKGLYCYAIHFSSEPSPFLGEKDLNINCGQYIASYDLLSVQQLYDLKEAGGYNIYSKILGSDKDALEFFKVYLRTFTHDVAIAQDFL